MWACGGAALLEEHAKLKVWQKNQVEKNKKVSPSLPLLENHALSSICSILSGRS